MPADAPCQRMLYVDSSRPVSAHYRRREDQPTAPKTDILNPTGSPRGPGTWDSAVGLLSEIPDLWTA